MAPMPPMPPRPMGCTESKVATQVDPKKTDSKDPKKENAEPKIDPFLTGYDPKKAPETVRQQQKILLEKIYRESYTEFKTEEELKAEEEALNKVRKSSTCLKNTDGSDSELSPEILNLVEGDATEMKKLLVAAQSIQRWVRMKQAKDE